MRISASLQEKEIKLSEKHKPIIKPSQTSLQSSGHKKYQLSTSPCAFSNWEGFLILNLHLNPVFSLHMRSPALEMQVHLNYVIKQSVLFLLFPFSHVLFNSISRHSSKAGPSTAADTGFLQKEELAFQCHRVVTSPYPTWQFSHSKIPSPHHQEDNLETQRATAISGIAAPLCLSCILSAGITHRSHTV